jgi:hypothetical protein
MTTSITLSNGRTINTRTYRVLRTGDAKTAKSMKKGILTGIVYLAPAGLAGGPTVCPWASPECIDACLNRAGRGQLAINQQARVDKTLLLFEFPEVFWAILERDIARLMKTAERVGLRAAVRLDGTSNVLRHGAARRGLIARFPDVPFYDYTKAPLRTEAKFVTANPNMSVVYSLSERPNSEGEAEVYLRNGFGVAIVVATKTMAQSMIGGTMWGYPIVDGDNTDARFLEPGPRVFVLYAKGPAKKNGGRFVLRWNDSRILYNYTSREILATMSAMAEEERHVIY